MNSLVYFVKYGTKKGEFSSQLATPSFQLYTTIEIQIKREKLIKNFRERRFLKLIKNNLK